jgi:hypothetical protein
MTQTFVSLIYPNAIERNMSMVPEKLLCSVHRLKKKNYARKPCYFFKYMLKFEIKISLKNAIFWDVMPCGCCKNRCFRGM